MEHGIAERIMIDIDDFMSVDGLTLRKYKFVYVSLKSIGSVNTWLHYMHDCVHAC